MIEPIGIEHLPRTADDLAAWSVYADALIESGDARGELIAFDLSLDARPTIARAGRAAAMLAKLGDDVGTAGWCLGFVRELHVDERRVPRALATVRSTIGRFVERVHLDAYNADDLSLRALFAALPPTCTQIVVPHAARFEPPDATIDVVAPDDIFDGARRIRWRTDDRRTGETPLPYIPPWVTTTTYVNIAMQLAHATPHVWGLNSLGRDTLQVFRRMVGPDSLQFDGRDWTVTHAGQARQIGPGVPFVLTYGATRFTCTLET